ncbi:MAG: glutamate synthase-related protein [Pseudomonadota bacterium]
MNPPLGGLLYAPEDEHSACGVGLITRKDGAPTHGLLDMAHEALCAIPHRGGMSSRGVGDGAGISLDLCDHFFSRLVGQELQPRAFGVGNFFLPPKPESQARATAVVQRALRRCGLDCVHVRDVAVDDTVIESRGRDRQLPIRQWVFRDSGKGASDDLDAKAHAALVRIEEQAFAEPALVGLYPLSLSCRTQVLKGRLNAWEIMRYFADMTDPDYRARSLYFHTRFSTNTDPHPSMAQPFRWMAHNGELNTDKKNRLSETARANALRRHIVRPPGQSDSCRFDQTLQARLHDDGMDIVEAVVSMMPPAWENDTSLPENVRSMLAYFALHEEKNDGPAAVIFGDGDVVGARLDRLGFRPLRTVETEDFLVVSSEAGQVSFPEDSVVSRGRIEAGGMLFFDHRSGTLHDTTTALDILAARRDYTTLLADARQRLDALPDVTDEDVYNVDRYRRDLSVAGRFVAYNHNQESFRFLMDPMLKTGGEHVTAMGYGSAINALSDKEGGVAKYFSQRFAQVTNPPLDSLREADGMTLRVALGARPSGRPRQHKQLVIKSPVLTLRELLRIKKQTSTPWIEFDALFTPVPDEPGDNETALVSAIDALAERVLSFAQDGGGIAILTDRQIASDRAAIPMAIAISAISQRLIEEGRRLCVSLVIESGQVASSHHIACALGFGASAVYALAVYKRAEMLFPDDAENAYRRFARAAEKSLLKTMAKVGLCTAESYIGGEFFEPNFLDTSDPVLSRYFPNMSSPVGGVGFGPIARSASDWHARALRTREAEDIPILGLFKERERGAGHSFGTAAVRGFVDLTNEPLQFAQTGSDSEGDDADAFRRLTLNQLKDAFGLSDDGYVNTSFDRLSRRQIDTFRITPGYREFARSLAHEREQRPAALRDVLAFPADVTVRRSARGFAEALFAFDLVGNHDFAVRGLSVRALSDSAFALELTGTNNAGSERLGALGDALGRRFADDIAATVVEGASLIVRAAGAANDFLHRIVPAPPSIPLQDVQPASEITARLASGAMSHGALVASAHEAVAHGTNMVGAYSNCGEGGEHPSRHGTLRGSRIKQFASGRFGVWAGYLSDPCLEEIEIKIGQGAKPGEGGQLPAAKVNVEIAAARGGTPGVELISPPPHHDTYSIEDLAQLIHDAKAARVRVVVKLVSSEGIGTIAVGVAKAGADVINVAGHSGGTGAASVTSIKYTGRAAELGIAEVHQALSANRLREKVQLRCSGAMQTGSDVVKACLLGGDSFEFGTTALMMLRCVMARNCNVKCPAGLTTNAEAFDGDPRALAQYLLNLAHDVREILAQLGLESLDAARGRADLLHLLDHPASVGQLDLRRMLVHIQSEPVERPTYLEDHFDVDERVWRRVRRHLSQPGRSCVDISGIGLTNRDKSVGARLSVDIERWLNHEGGHADAAFRDDRGRAFLPPATVNLSTYASAGQSYGAFCNDGLRLTHTGTCNDGVGKGMCGGEIVVRAAGARHQHTRSVLVGNFALFGATGGRLFVAGEAGDRFAVRNSGATAVVEGVGDFCCEYMTNGAVLNIGPFARGFGNGMSGGFAYQYDPDNRLESAVSHDDVLVGTLSDDREMARVHSVAVKQMLEWHLASTGSGMAKRLLDDWAVTRTHIRYLMPRALLLYQDADEILAAASHRELLSEVASAMARYQIRRLKTAWKSGEPVLEGEVPDSGNVSDEHNETARAILLNNWTVMDTALEIARGRVSDASELDARARQLVLTEDYALMSALSQHAVSALRTYDDAGLAALISNKRLNDFKRALRGRTVRSMDALATTGWIIHQDRRNRALLGEIPSFEALFAGHAVPSRLEAVHA